MRGTGSGCGMMLVVACVAAQLAAGEIFTGGLWKEFVYDKPSREPVVFGGESRSVEAIARDYCIYLDMWFGFGHVAHLRKLIEEGCSVTRHLQNFGRIG